MSDTAGVGWAAVTRRERIAFLLAHYSDVLAGVWDRGLGGDHLPLMCRAWNGVSYQELERLLPLLCVEARPLYRAVVGQFIQPRFVRRAVCPRCGTVKPPNLAGELHIHPNRKGTAFVARMTRVPLYPVRECDVDDAIVWLDDHWRGGVFIPDELLGLVAVA
jgi:lysophospholipase L1-like esterase